MQWKIVWNKLFSLINVFIIERKEANHKLRAVYLQCG